MYESRADILRDIKRFSYGVTSQVQAGGQNKVVINIEDDEPREIEIINFGKVFCITVHYKNKKPCNINTKHKGIDTAASGAYQCMSLSIRSKAYAGFLEFYNKLKSGSGL